jgi:hypothetical protein
MKNPKNPPNKKATMTAKSILSISSLHSFNSLLRLLMEDRADHEKSFGKSNLFRSRGIGFSFLLYRHLCQILDTLVSKILGKFFLANEIKLLG